MNPSREELMREFDEAEDLRREANHRNTGVPGLMGAGEGWAERWCDDHLEVPDSTCLACVGESHDAWMHRAKAAEMRVVELEVLVEDAIDLAGSAPHSLANANAYRRITKRWRELKGE